MKKKMAGLGQVVLMKKGDDSWEIAKVPSVLTSTCSFSDAILFLEMDKYSNNSRSLFFVLRIETNLKGIIMQHEAVAWVLCEQTFQHLWPHSPLAVSSGRGGSWHPVMRHFSSLGYDSFSVMLFTFHTLYSFFFFNWSLAALQYWVSFCYTTKWISCMCTQKWASQVVLVVKNLPVSAGDVRDPGSIAGSAGRHGNPL